LLLVLVIGRPACGKTTIVNRARNILDHENVRSAYVTDYDLLEKYLEDPNMKGRIEPYEPKGFIITDMNVLDEVLDDVCSAVHAAADKVGVVFVDFSRASYCSAINRIIGGGCRPDLVVYLNVSLSTVRRRNKYREVFGNHIVPDEKMVGVFAKDDLVEVRRRKDIKLLEIPNDEDGEEEARRVARTLAHAVLDRLKKAPPPS